MSKLDISKWKINFSQLLKCIAIEAVSATECKKIIGNCVFSLKILYLSLYLAI